MLRSLLSSGLATLALVATPASAAEVTELPPFLRGDISLGYAFQHVAGSLQEGGENVGFRTWEEHGLTYQGVFSAGPGIAVFFDLPQTLSARLAFPEAREMTYDPSAGHGTMIGTDPIEDLEPIKGKGAEGLWLGIKGTPFSEAFTRRGNRATWLIEAAFQTKTKSNFYALDAEGQRGAGVGGGGTRLGMAFSTTRNIAKPYLAFRYTRCRPIEVSLYDAEGTLLVSGETIDPADRIDIRTGTELVLHDNTDSHSRFTLDLRFAFGYATWQTVPSGLYLPSVLDINRAMAATESEHAWVGGGLGMQHQAFQYLAWSLGADVTYHAPYRVEHLYDVTTGPDTFDITGWGGLKVMIR